METNAPLEFTDTEQSPDYRQKTRALFEQRGIDIPDITLHKIADQLDSLRATYDKHHYHNDIHSFDNIVRGFRLLDIIGNYIDITAKEYELLAVASVFHDDIITNPDDAPLTPEQESTYKAINVMDYDSDDSLRLMKIITVTEVEYDANGVHQIHFTNDDNDVLRFALGLADVGAILMEGRQRMIADVVNLSLERYWNSDSRSETTLDSLALFLKAQRNFIDERLRDLEQGITHYFSDYDNDTLSAISDDLHALITPNVKEVQPVLSKLDTHFSDIEYKLKIALRGHELRGKKGSAASIARKLTTIIDAA